MMRPKQIPGVPVQNKGGFHDTESSRPCKVLEIDSEFNILKERFFSINKWKGYSGSASADFRHFDCSGNPTDRIPIKGDFIRISIPGSGTKKGKGYDWAEIINISHRETSGSESYVIMCRPCREPRKSSGYIAHFYSPSATSTFMISKEGNVLKAGIYGRNEKPNYNTTFSGKIRNFFIGFAGILGFSKIQWKLLSEGLLDFI